MTQRRLERAFVAVAVFGAGAVAAARRLGDFDLPWHLAFGRLVASTRSVPYVDDMTYPHPRITYCEWISDVALYAVEHLGGPGALQVAGGALAAAITVLIALRTGDRRVEAPRGAVVALAMAAIAPWLIVRPATITLVLAGLMVWLFERRAAWALAATVPLTALWANVHQGVLVAPPLALGWAAHVVLQRARGRAETGPGAMATVACALGVVAAACVSRAGPSLLVRPFLIAPMATIATEWAPLTLDFILRQEPLAGAFFLLAAAALAFGRDARTGSRAPAPFNVALAVIAVFLLKYVRMIPLAVVLLAPIVARRLGHAPALGGGADVPPDPRADLRTRITRLVSLGGYAAVPLALVARLGAELGAGFDATHFPEAAVAWIERAAPAGKMWNFAPFGGWLEWRLYPRYRPFVDGRVLDPPTARRAHDSEFDAAAFAALASEYDMQWAVCRAREGEAFCIPVFASEEWRMVFWDDVSAVYVRSGGLNARIAEGGYARLRHLTPLGEVLETAVAPPTRERASELRHDGDLALAQAPTSPRAALLAAAGALAEGDHDAFESARGRLAELAPGHPAVDLLARAWQARRPPEAGAR